MGFHFYFFNQAMGSMVSLMTKWLVVGIDHSVIHG